MDSESVPNGRMNGMVAQSRLVRVLAIILPGPMHVYHTVGLSFCVLWVLEEDTSQCRHRVDVD